MVLQGLLLQPAVRARHARAVAQLGKGETGVCPVSYTHLFHSRRFWLLTAVLFFQNCTEIAVTGWMVTYFKDTGILSGTAGQLTVTVIWGAMLAARLVIALVLQIRNGFRALTLMTLSLIHISASPPSPADTGR